VNVADEFGKVLIALAEYRLVTPLQQVTRLSMLAIVILAIGGQESLHNPADGVILPFDQQMNVIGHQAVGIKVEREPRFLVGELKQEFAAVVVRSKDELAIVASSDYVVETALDFESRLAHSASSLRSQHRYVKCELHFCTPDPSPALQLPTADTYSKRRC
jgi:hypothetical protein